jgi:hypothetical protein
MRNSIDEQEAGFVTGTIVLADDQYCSKDVTKNVLSACQDD